MCGTVLGRSAGERMKGSQRLGEFELQLRGIRSGLGYEQPPFEHLQLQAQLLVGRAKSIALLGQSRRSSASAIRAARSDARASCSADSRGSKEAIAAPALITNAWIFIHEYLVDPRIGKIGLIGIVRSHFVCLSVHAHRSGAAPRRSFDVDAVEQIVENALVDLNAGHVVLSMFAQPPSNLS